MLTAELGDVSRMHDEKHTGKGIGDLAFEQPYGVAHERDVMDVPVAGVGQSILGRAAILSGACLATMLGASLIRRENPLQTLEVLAQGIGVGRPRIFDRILPIAVGAAVMIGGGLFLAAIDHGLRKATAHGPAAVGRITSAVARR